MCSPSKSFVTNPPCFWKPELGGVCWRTPYVCSYTVLLSEHTSLITLDVSASLCIKGRAPFQQISHPLLFHTADRISITGPSIRGTSLHLLLLVAVMETWRRRVGSSSMASWTPHRGIPFLRLCTGSLSPRGAGEAIPSWCGWKGELGGGPV